MRDMQELIEKNKPIMEPHIKKLIETLKKEKINYEGEDTFGNVVFTCKDKEKRIRGVEFYRVNGIYSFKRDIGEQSFELVPMSNSMFYNSLMKTVLMYVFYPPEPKKQ